MIGGGRSGGRGSRPDPAIAPGYAKTGGLLLLAQNPAGVANGEDVSRAVFDTHLNLRVSQGRPFNTEPTVGVRVRTAALRQRCLATPRATARDADFQYSGYCYDI